MRKITKITGVLLMTTMFYGCGSVVEKDIDEPVIVSEVTEEEITEVVEEITVMNSDNNEEFARLVTGPITDQEIIEFFDEHVLEDIEFDGVIDYIGLIPGKSSRLSIIISTGDGSGAAFIVRDIGATDSIIRDFINDGNADAGVKVHIKGNNKGYHDESGLISISLDHISVR